MNSQLNKIIDAIKNKNYFYAETICWSALQNNPNNFQIKKHLALALLLQNKIYGAIDKYEELYKENENDFDIINNLCHLYLMVENFSKANDLNEIAINLRPDSYYCYLNKGDLLFKKRKYHEAKVNLDRAIELAGGINVYAHILHLVQLYGDNLIALGNSADAIQFVDQCFQINKDPTIFYYLMNLDPKLYDKKFIDQFVDENLNKNFHSDSHKFQVLAPLYFGLGRYSEKLNSALSEACYIKANELSSLVQRFKPLDHQRHIGSIKKLYNKYIQDNQQVDENNGEGFVFIIGMPRSGTTLVESIISTAEEVFSGGEMISIPEILKKYYEGDREGRPSLDEISHTYINRMNFLRDNKKIFIDKLPSNFYHVGFILLAMPKAKIVHIKRDPWDVAISLFKQLYISNIPYASKFFNIATTIANYEHLMDFWHQQNLNDKILEVKYEELVNEEQLSAEKIFNFIGIKAQYDSSKRSNFFSRTASKIQIKSEIHSKSVKKNDFSGFKEVFLRDYGAQKRFWDIQS